MKWINKVKSYMKDLASKTCGCFLVKCRKENVNSHKKADK